MQKVFYLFFLIFISTFLIARESISPSFNKVHISNFCKLPLTKTIVIGCTKKCNKYYLKALKEVANKLNYKIKIITLNYKQTYDKALSSVDAIISPGGHDIEPKYYIKYLNLAQKNKIMKNYKEFGKTNYEGKIRDNFEYNLFRVYFTNQKYKKIPILGICYGAQMLASVKGIPLYVDIKNNLNISNRRKLNDRIFMNKNSSLFNYLHKQSFVAYKNHHQAINLKFFNSHKTLFPQTKITATSNKGKIAEIVEFTNRPAIGVQFHPERSNFKVKEAIFKKFLIDACKKKMFNK